MSDSGKFLDAVGDDRHTASWPAGIRWGPRSQKDARIMFETRIQTYWADADAAGIVFFPNFFRLVQCAEEELFRAAGTEMVRLYDEHQLMMPRVESFSKFMRPIKLGGAVCIQLRASFTGEKTVRLEFSFLSVEDRSLLAEGYLI